MSQAAKTEEGQSGNVLMEIDNESELDKAVVLARERLRKLKDLPAELRDIVAGGYDECLAKVQQELSTAQAARRAGNPLSKQLESGEAHKARMAKKLEDAKATLQAREEELVLLHKQIGSQKAAVAEAEEAAAKAVSEVATLATKFASERSDASSAQGPAEAPAGYVSVSFAEQKWAEREAAFSAQLAQLQAMVDSQDDGGSVASEACPSIADDLGSVEELEKNETWNQVAPARRKALLRRERDVLAKKFRTSLGKASMSSSPFIKKGGAGPSRC